MKKILRVISTTVLLLFSINTAALAAPPPWSGGYQKNKEVKQLWKQERKAFKGKIKLNGKVLKFDVSPYEFGGRILIPLRAVAATLKAEVTYKTDGSKQVITIEKNDNVIKLVMDSSNKKFTITLNGKKVDADSYPEIRNGRTFVPLRLLATLLGLKVNYNGDIELVEECEDDDKDELEEQLKKAEKISFRWYDFDEEGFESQVRVIEGKLNKQNSFSSLKFAVLGDDDDEDDLENFERTVPKVRYDFDDYLYLWGFGKAKTGGYNLYINEVRQLGKTVWVKVYLVTPAKDDIVTQAISYPYDLVRIKKADLVKDGKLNFIFLDQNNKQLAKIVKTIE